MQDIIGVVLLVALAVCFRLYLHSTVGLNLVYRDVIRVFPFSVIAFWVLLAMAAAWFLFAALALAVRTR